MKGKAYLLGIAMVAGAALLGDTASAIASPANTPGDCHRVHVSLNSHVGWWQTDCRIVEVVGNTGVPVHATTSGASKIVGNLSPGWRRFYRQRAGSWSHIGPAHADNVWAGTYASNGRWGFVNELWFSAPSIAGGPPACFANLPWRGSPPRNDTCLA